MEQRMQLQPGDRVLVGSTLFTVSREFAESLNLGDRIVGIEHSGVLRRIPHDVHEMVTETVGDSLRAFRELSSSSADDIRMFFSTAASLLSDDEVFRPIQTANDEDVHKTRQLGRSTTRLVLSAKMRQDMIAAFEMWRDISVQPFVLTGTTEHPGWIVEHWNAPLGVIGFVFEGRPNVFADATGVLRTGNTVVFRIGSDALGTARAIMEWVIRPALRAASLPIHAVSLLESREHAAGWSLFSDSRVALAVARGSGEAVSELGSIARQAGVPVSLHGTGGAWIIVGENANNERLSQVVKNSLDRKVCNTVNVVVVLASRAAEDVPVIVRAADSAARARGTRARIHCVNGAISHIPELEDVEVVRASGVFTETQCTVADESELVHEFEWEESPEFFLAIANDVSHAIEMFNSYSPQFVVSIISDSEDEIDKVWRQCNAPFVGDGFTRWVDGQFALNRPELGLSNWQFGRLFGRGGILSGDSAFTVRLRVRQHDENLHR